MSRLVPLVLITGMFCTVAALERFSSLRFAPSPFFRRYLGTDVGWYLIASTANVIAAFIVLPVLTRFSLPGVAGTLHRLPWPARLGMAVVAYDFAAFAVHVGLHRSQALWSLHKVHHSSLQLDWLATTRAHMLENLVRQVSAQLPLVVLGLPPSTVAGALVVYAGFALHGHSNLRVGPRWLETVFITPRLHRVHHVPASSQTNFGTIFTVWDRLFGRLDTHGSSPEDRLGVPEEIDTYPQRLLDALREPFREGQARRVAAGQAEAPTT